MSRLLLGKINLSKIDKTRLFKGEKGTYLDLTIWIHEEPDRYGRDAGIQQSTKKGEEKIYLGDAKFFDTQKTESPPPDDDEDLDLPF